MNLPFHDPSDTLYNAYITIQFYHLISKQEITFKAFLTDFADDYQQEWDSRKVFGRMDAIENFTTTVRQISLGWDLVAASENEAIENLQKCAALASMQYPSFSGNNEIAEPPIFQLRFMNLAQNVNDSAQQSRTYDDIINKLFFNLVDVTSPLTAKEAGLLGRMKGFKYAPVVDEGMFILEGGLYPKYVKMSCEFTVWHRHELGWNDKGTQRQPNFPYGVAAEAPKDETALESVLSTIDDIAEATKNLLGIF